MQEHMYLITAATRFEMRPYLDNFFLERTHELITGVGPVETTVRLMAFLNENYQQVKGVVNFGVGGAYIDPAGKPRAELLDVCLAETEVLGDFGVCLEDQVEPISGKELEVPSTFVMDADLLELASLALQKEEIPYRKGNFVTVNCTTGTEKRGRMLSQQYSGLCENMEGAAVARVCQEFGLPFLEVRCISNLVEDRDKRKWQLKKACTRSGEVAAAIVHHLVMKKKKR